jgi:RNA polymerase sigma-70 factor (ECF subfamily)
MGAHPPRRASLQVSGAEPASAEPLDLAEEQALLARIRAGDEQAFERLFRAYYRGLRAFAARLVHSEDAAEDLVADLFVRLWDQRAFWGEQLRGSARTYLYQAVRNAALNTLRHARVEARWRARVEARGDAEIAIDEWAADASSRVVGGELVVAVGLAIERLPERCREVYTLSRRHGLGYDEIATVMGISTNTVKAQMGNALRLLRRHLSPFLAIVLFLVKP